MAESHRATVRAALRVEAHKTPTALPKAVSVGVDSARVLRSPARRGDRFHRRCVTATPSVTAIASLLGRIRTASVRLWSPISRSLATLSQRCLLQAVSSYLAWNATACLKALQSGGNELPLLGVLGNSTYRGCKSRYPKATCHKHHATIRILRQCRLRSM